LKTRSSWSRLRGVSFTINAIAADGKTTWFEGVLLLAAYVVLGMAFFFVQR
jgi:Ca2+:H+ antiporter